MFGCTFCLVLAGRAAHASAGDKAAPLTLEAATAALRSPDPNEVARGIDALAERGGRTALRTLGEFVAQGQADAATDRALIALGKFRSQEALPWLFEFSRHRRAEARLAAYGATAAIPGEAPEALIAAGLRDSDPRIRGLCARSLGERGAKRQLELLFVALERGVPEAGAAIGRIGDASVAARLHAQLGKLPIQVLLDGYEALLRRDDIAEATKLEIIARLGEVASPSVKQFLLQMFAQTAPAKTRLRQALADTAKRIDDRATQGGAR